MVFSDIASDNVQKRSGLRTEKDHIAYEIDWNELYQYENNLPFKGATERSESGNAYSCH